MIIRLREIWVDGGYCGELLKWVTDRFRFVLAVVLRSNEQKGFVLLPLINELSQSKLTPMRMADSYLFCGFIKGKITCQ